MDASVARTMHPSAIAAQKIEFGKNTERMESPEAILEKKMKKIRG
jgi:hypothetical protein